MLYRSLAIPNSSLALFFWPALLSRRSFEEVACKLPITTSELFAQTRSAIRRRQHLSSLSRSQKTFRGLLSVSSTRKTSSSDKISRRIANLLLSSSWLAFLQPLSLPLVSPSIHCWAVNTRYIHDLQLLQERLQLFKLCTLLSTLSATNLSTHIQSALDVLSYTTYDSPVDGLLLPFSTTAADTDYLGHSRFPLFDPDTNRGRLCHRRSTAQFVRRETLANRFTEE